MTEFEQEVEEALAHVLVVPRDGDSYVGFYRRAMDALAPRVAAANQGRGELAGGGSIQ